MQMKGHALFQSLLSLKGGAILIETNAITLQQEMHGAFLRMDMDQKPMTSEELMQILKIYPQFKLILKTFYLRYNS